MKHRIAFLNARIMDPESGFDNFGYLLIEDDLIVERGSGSYNFSLEAFDQIIDCNSRILCPGIIDIQVHFRDPGQTHKEDLISGSRSAAAGGVTTVVCQPNTVPVLDNELAIDYLNEKSRISSLINVLFYGAITKNMQGNELSDMKMIHDKGACGFTDDGKPVMNSNIMLQAMKNAAKFKVPIAQHAEDISLSGKGCINLGEVSKKLGVIGIPSISETIMVERDLRLCEMVPDCHYHVLHVSAKETVDVIRAAKKRGINVTCEAAPHHFTIDESIILTQGTMAKMNPPLKTREDVNAIIEGIVDGTIDCIATDHAPHDEKSKSVPISDATFGIVGLETMLPLSLALYSNGHISMMDVISKLTYSAAEIINLKDRGRLRNGCKADILIFDHEIDYKINISEFSSKSFNSPFDGLDVKGMVLMTIANGKIVYQNKRVQSLKFIKH